jgi:hypothetical protein
MNNPVVIFEGLKDRIDTNDRIGSDNLEVHSDIIDRNDKIARNLFDSINRANEYMAQAKALHKPVRLPL